MTAAADIAHRSRTVIDGLYYLTAVFFFVYLFVYYWTGEGGPVLLAITLVPVTFILFTLDELRRNEFYPQIPARTVPISKYSTCMYTETAIEIAM